MSNMTIKPSQPTKETRESKQQVETAFNDFLQVIWSAGLDPAEVGFSLPQNIAYFLIGSRGIKVKEFIYCSDFGDIRVEVRDERL